MQFLRTIAVTAVLGSTVLGCATSPPRNTANLCQIFEERRSWYRAAQSAESRWGIPIAVNMAFIYQESSFRARARPDRSRLLWIFPGPRPSSAYGYAQAVDATWEEYERLSGNRNPSRANFADAVDFVAWYNANSNRSSRIAPDDARNLYFAYHEGNRGYQQGRHLNKDWLLAAGNNVQTNASRFAGQLANCRARLDQNWFQRIFS